MSAEPSQSTVMEPPGESYCRAKGGSDGSGVVDVVGALGAGVVVDRVVAGGLLGVGAVVGAGIGCGAGVVERAVGAALEGTVVAVSVVAVSVVVVVVAVAVLGAGAMLVVSLGGTVIAEGGVIVVEAGTGAAG
jgi:hypothetical protein